MGNIIIFFIAFFSIILFILSVIFNSIASIIAAFEKTIFYILMTFIIVGFVVLSLEFCVNIISNRGNLWSFIGGLVIMVIATLYIFGIIGNIVLVFIEEIVKILTFAISFIQKICVYCAEKCERYFDKLVEALNDKTKEY